ncbi:MAG: hypothetical protein R3A11_00940 [Bdellovibrionota bacterium]
METVRVNTPSPKETPSRETALRDFVRFSWKATRGLVDKAESDVKKLVTALSKSGKITPEQEQQLFQQVYARMKDNRVKFEQDIEGHIQNTVSKITKIYQDEIYAIEQNIDRLEKKFQNLK